jgi:hypothetical protein
LNFIAVLPLNLCAFPPNEPSAPSGCPHECRDISVDLIVIDRDWCLCLFLFFFPSVCNLSLADIDMNKNDNSLPRHFNLAWPTRHWLISWPCRVVFRASRSAAGRSNLISRVQGPLPTMADTTSFLLVSVRQHQPLVRIAVCSWASQDKKLPVFR